MYCAAVADTRERNVRKERHGKLEPYKKAEEHHDRSTKPRKARFRRASGLRETRTAGLYSSGRKNSDVGEHCFRTFDLVVGSGGN
jgi:hypothetical protein